MRERSPSPPALTRRLGSGLVASAGVGNKGALLDRGAQARLPIPPGYVLLDAAWQQARQVALVAVHGATVVAPDPDALLACLHLPPLAGMVAVRSAFAVEDRADESLAGLFASRLWVDPSDASQLVTALCDVWASALRLPAAVRRDVLIMRMVPAVHAGVAFTEQEFEDDLVNYTTGTAERLVAGQIAGAALTLPKLRAWERRAGPPPATPWAARVQRLLRRVRRVFGSTDWDIEWADDGSRCWLVQIRPITRPTRRNEVLTRANFKEILPELPSHFMTSLMASCADGLFAHYRRFDASLPARRPLTEVCYGRPVFNLSLLTDMLRHWGLPARLVTAGIGGTVEAGHGLKLGRLFQKAPVLLCFGLAQLRAVSAARQTIRTMLKRTEQPGRTFTDCVATLQWLYTTLVTEMLSLTAAMSVPLCVLRASGVLAEHSARQQTIGTAMFTDLEPLRALAASQAAVREACRRGQLPTDPVFGQLWEQCMAKHGHRGIYESDIAQPRLHEAPQTLLASLIYPGGARQPIPPHSLRGLLTLPLWWYTGRTIRAREELRYQSMRGFDRVRQRLLALAARAVKSGLLPTPETLWLLTIDEVERLDAGWQPSAEFLTRRQRDIARSKAVRVPDVWQRFDNLDSTVHGLPDTGGERRLAGVSLTTGEVQGRAWVLTEPHTTLPQGYTPERTILVAQSIDAGWIPTFACVAGVVVEIGGDLSHGSIMLRELGLPAITNVAHATQHIQTGDTLLLRAGAGVVERIET